MVGIQPRLHCSVVFSDTGVMIVLMLFLGLIRLICDWNIICPVSWLWTRHQNWHLYSVLILVIYPGLSFCSEQTFYAISIVGAGECDPQGLRMSVKSEVSRILRGALRDPGMLETCSLWSIWIAKQNILCPPHFNFQWWFFLLWHVVLCPVSASMQNNCYACFTSFHMGLHRANISWLVGLWF
jgi:hypothetical protein